MPRDAGFTDVATTIEQRTGHEIRWGQDAAIRARLSELLAGEVSLSGAVQAALLGNPTLQATYEELMIAQSDLVQAGLLRNPTLSGRVGFPIPASSASIAYGFGVEVDFLDLLLLPARKRLASAELEAAKLRVGNAVLALAHRVRCAYYALQAAQQVGTLRRTVLEAAEASVELTRRQHDAGNISELDLANEEGLHEQERLDVFQSEADILGARERLVRLLGLWGTSSRWWVSPTLAELPAEEPTVEHFEDRALRDRLDVAEARQKALASSRALEMAKNYRLLGGAAVGTGLDRDPEGRIVAGPSASLELPIFDARQAVIARLEARLRQAERQLAARSIDATSEVREAWGRVALARAVVARYHVTVIPLRERILALSQRYYDATLLGVFQLLVAKQAEVNAYREYIEAVRDYWINRSELERALGGCLAPPG